MAIETCTVNDRLKIMNIVGARPNLPKIAPLMREMRHHSEIEPTVLGYTTYPGTIEQFVLPILEKGGLSCECLGSGKRRRRL